MSANAPRAAVRLGASSLSGVARGSGSGRTHPLLFDSCRCRLDQSCLACARWQRHYRHVQARQASNAGTQGQVRDAEGLSP